MQWFSNLNSFFSATFLIGWKAANGSDWNSAGHTLETRLTDAHQWAEIGRWPTVDLVCYMLSSAHVEWVYVHSSMYGRACNVQPLCRCKSGFSNIRYKSWGCCIVAFVTSVPKRHFNGFWFLNCLSVMIVLYFSLIRMSHYVYPVNVVE